MSTAASTVVVVPAYREQEALPSTLASLRSHLPAATVVVVDDGSPDATAAVAARSGARVISLPFNLGVGAAVRTGLRAACALGAERVVIVDADGQHDPADAVRLLGTVDDGADLVVGSRFAEDPSGYEVSWLRGHAMGLLHRLVRWRTGLALTDTTSGFRAMNRPVAEMLARDYPVEYLADTVEVLITVANAGFTVRELPVTMNVRAGGVPSNRRLRLAVNYLRLLVGILGSLTLPRSRPERT